jgi:hypothetical protein
VAVASTFEQGAMLAEHIEQVLELGPDEHGVGAGMVGRFHGLTPAEARGCRYGCRAPSAHLSP